MPVPQNESADTPPEQPSEQDQEAKALLEKLNQTLAQTQADAQQLAQRLQGQMERGELEIETDGPNIIVRLREQGSFESGSADLNPRPRLPSPPSRVYCRLNKGVFWCWAIRTTSPSKPPFSLQLGTLRRACGGRGGCLDEFRPTSAQPF